MKRAGWKPWLYIGIIIVVAGAAAGLIWLVAHQTVEQTVSVAQQDESQPTTTAPAKDTSTPQLTTEVVLSGRDHVWEVAFLPTKEMLFTERKGVVSIVKDGKTSSLITVGDIAAKGEGGLLGMAVDPAFADNHFIYTCFNSTAKDVRVVRWHLKADLSGADGSTSIITGMPANTSGRHSGCRLAFGPDGYLWVGTGDTAKGDTSIQPKSLGGKILRVDRDGNAAPGNVGGNYNARIYSYGHRNVQGLAFFGQPKLGVLGVNVEHGSTVDDEVNPLAKGNFGWAPTPSGYNESGVPMTDKTRFPDAVEAVWSSGNPTQAPSGATMLSGTQWKGWDGALAVAVLKDKHLKILQFDDSLKVTKEEKVLAGTFGRLRAAAQGPDGNLYISTDNGGDDKIIRITPN